MRADGLAVVAELAVVVVLDDQPAGCAGPVDDRGRRAGPARRPSGNWCAGVSSDRGRRRPSASTAAPRSSTGSGAQAAARRARDDRAVAGQARTPRRRGASPRAAAAPRRAAPALGEAGADHDPARGRRARRGPGPGSRPAPAQLRPAPRVAVAERVGRARSPARAGAARQPGRPREGREVGRARPQVVARAAAAAAAARGAGAGPARPPRSATRVPEPCRAASQPSATSWPYASATVLRAMPRSAASAREDGSRRAGAQPAASRTASRSACSSAARARGAGQVEVQVDARKWPMIPAWNWTLSLGRSARSVGRMTHDDTRSPSASTSTPTPPASPGPWPTSTTPPTKELDRVGIDPALRELVRIRASQLNGCAYCIDMHSQGRPRGGRDRAAPLRAAGLAETPFFTGPASAPRWPSPRRSPGWPTTHVPAAAYDAVAEHFCAGRDRRAGRLIVTINAWNAISVSTRAWVPGSYVRAD